MGTILTKSKSLFYQGLDEKNGNVMLNKRHIISAIQRGQLNVDVAMSSGETFKLLMDATQFGELIFLLHEVEHKNEAAANP